MVNCVLDLAVAQHIEAPINIVNNYQGQYCVAAFCVYLGIDFNADMRMEALRCFPTVVITLIAIINNTVT